MYYWNKMRNHMSNWFEYGKEHLLRILVIALVFIIVCYLLWLFPRVNILNGNLITEQHILLMGITLENWFTWLSMVGLAFAAIWAVYQFDKSTVLKQQEKASEIAQEFADNLVERMGLISGVLMRNQEIQKILQDLDTSKLNQFTAMEMLEIIKCDKCFEDFNRIITSNRTQKRYRKILNSIYNKTEREKFDSYFPLLIENTLNKLEAICINISSQAAGSQFIYDSLHQMFLSTIEILSIKISSSNTNNVDKHYINIISVYNMWNKQKQKDIDKLNKTNKRIFKLEKRKDKEIKKLLNKQTKTV